MVPSTTNQEGDIIPRGLWFKVELNIDEAYDGFSVQTITRGVAVIDAMPESFANRIFRQIASVLIRESGF